MDESKWWSNGYQTHSGPSTILGSNKAADAVSQRCIEGASESARATLIGRFKGRVIRNVSHRPPVGLRPASPLGFRVPYGSPEFGCSFASKSAKGSAGSVPMGGPLSVGGYVKGNDHMLARSRHGSDCVNDSPR